MQKSSLISFIFILVINCMGISQQSTSYTIILDLSDRILEKDQIKKDVAAIQNIFNAFEEEARKKLFIKSRDAFKILIIPQKGSNLDVLKYEKMLDLDLSTLMIADKVNKVKEMQNNIQQYLLKLYSEARFSEHSSDFAGVDIWQYFNEVLEYKLSKDAVNKVYLVTDGYMDFENYHHQIVEGNLYTSTSFLKHLRIPEWKEKAENECYGILPLNNKLKIDEFHLVGLKSKVHDLREIDRLRYFWNKWLMACGIQKASYLIS